MNFQFKFGKCNIIILQFSIQYYQFVDDWNSWLYQITKVGDFTVIIFWLYTWRITDGYKPLQEVQYRSPASTLYDKVCYVANQELCCDYGKVKTHQLSCQYWATQTNSIKIWNQKQHFFSHPLGHSHAFSLSFCAASMKKKFIKGKGGISCQYLDPSLRGYGQNNNFCGGSWVLHPQQVSSKSINRSE